MKGMLNEQGFEEGIVEVKPNDLPLLIPDFSGRMNCLILEEEAEKIYEVMKELMKNNFPSRPTGI